MTSVISESGFSMIGHITLDAKSAGKPYEGKPHVRFDEKALEIGLEGNFSYYASALLYRGERRDPPGAKFGNARAGVCGVSQPSGPDDPGRVSP
jgi:hypothetical protein